MAQRKRHSTALKAKVALEAVRGQRTVNEIASEFGVHPGQVAQWKRQLLEGASEVFENGHSRATAENEETTARLYQEIGKLKVELDWLKKKAGA